VGLFEWLVSKFETTLPQAADQPARGLIQGVGLHSDQSVEKIKSYGCYMVHEGFLSPMAGEMQVIETALRIFSRFTP
jgi:hypothetical protein